MSHTVSRTTKPAASFIGETLPFDLAPEDRQVFQTMFNRFPGMVHLGARIDLADDHLVDVHVDEIKPFHLGGMGTQAVNGAMISALFDCALGVAGVIHLGAWKNEGRYGTIDLSVQFLRPFFGEQLHARAGVVKKAAKIAFARAELLDAHGRCCSTATAIIAGG